MSSIIGATWIIRYKKAKQKPKARKHECYIDRNNRLSWLGYTSYREYLASDQWQEIRGKKLDMQPKCVACDSQASQVHHMDYFDNTLLGLCMGAMASLCEECHELFHNVLRTNGEPNLFSKIK